MYLSSRDSAIFFTISVAFSGYLLTVISLKGWREPRAVDMILVIMLEEKRGWNMTRYTVSSKVQLDFGFVNSVTDVRYDDRNLTSDRR